MPAIARTALATLVLLALAIPAQGAYSFGTIVDKNDYDFQQAPTIRGTVPVAAKFVLPCFTDIDGDGVATRDEPIYLAVRTGLTAACEYVRGKDVRLVPVGALGAGTEVKVDMSEPDTYKGLVQLGTVAVPMHAIRVFNDGDAATTVRKTDTVYLDLVNVGIATPRADIGDVRLSPYGALKAGSRVQAGDPDQNMVLQEMNAGVPKNFYTVNMVFEFGKAWYLNADIDALAGGAVEEGDVRLTATVPNPFADIAANVGNPGKVVESLSFSSDEVQAGAPFQAYILVKNPTTKVGSALVQTSLDGVLMDARGTPTLALNEVATLVVTFVAPLEPGQHKVQAGETTAFFEVVGAPASEATEEAAPASAKVQKQGAPAVTAVAPIAALALALVVLRRLA